MCIFLYHMVLLIIIFIPTILVSIFTIVKYLYQLLTVTKFQAVGASIKLTFVFVKLGIFICCKKEYSLIKNIGMFYMGLLYIYIFMEEEYDFIKE